MEENKTVIDTRTFQEIWKSLSPIEQGHLRYQLIQDTTYTRQAINAWVNGSIPVNIMARKAVVLPFVLAVGAAKLAVLVGQSPLGIVDLVLQVRVKLLDELVLGGAVYVGAGFYPEHCIIMLALVVFLGVTFRVELVGFQGATEADVLDYVLKLHVHLLRNLRHGVHERDEEVVSVALGSGLLLGRKLVERLRYILLRVGLLA